LAVGHADVKDVDQAARLILEELTSVDQKEKTLKINLKFLEYESSEAYGLFEQGRHLAALTRILEDRVFGQRVREAKYFIIAIDEADKCPIPLAGLMRNLSTRIELEGISNIRFILSGVTPFFEKMIAADEGVNRFVYKHIALEQLDETESEDLLQTKFRGVVLAAEEEGIGLTVDPSVIERVVRLCGGHPHLLQLLGSHIIEHESENPDNVLDSKDLVGSLNSICYESRGRVYERLIHTMQMEDKFSAFKELMALAGGSFPGTIDRKDALLRMEEGDLDWFLSRNFIWIMSKTEYRIVDEFLRIRVIMDELGSEQGDLEDQIIYVGGASDLDELFSQWDEDVE
jgi:hypothetical protein